MNNNKVQETAKEQMEKEEQKEIHGRISFWIHMISIFIVKLKSYCYYKSLSNIAKSIAKACPLLSH